MHVCVTLLVLRGDVCKVDFQYLHPGVIDLLTYEHDIKKIVHRTIMRRVRPMLHTLAIVSTVQRDMERQNRAQKSAMGSRGINLKLVVDPVIFHDACTLYMGCASGFYGYYGFGNHRGSWFAASKCACGHNSWGMSCTPPRITKNGSLVRDCYDDMVAFCWICLARPGRD